MTDSFEVLTSQDVEEPTATVVVSLSVLREMLRLPKDVLIVGVEMDPARMGHARMVLSGPGLPQGHGPASVKYVFEHHTIVKCVGVEREPAT